MSAYSYQAAHIVFVFLCFWHFVGLGTFARNIMVTRGSYVTTWGYFLMQLAIVLLWIYVAFVVLYFFWPLF
jgi:hypothetical protein